MESIEHTNYVIISHIDQVLPEIEGRKDFIHAVKEGYQVIDYLYEDGDTFATPIRQQCRGIKFDLDGRTIGRPFHKFFNYGQKLITYDWSSKHRIMTKLDGSMVHSCIINKQLRLCTRMGITEQSIEAEKYLTESQKRYLKDLNLMGYNAIFEFTAPNNRIVIEYDKPELTLLAIRSILTGAYHQIGYIEREFNVVETHDIKLGDDNIEQIRAETTGIEGYVVSWPDGTYVKIKTDEYTQMHRAVSYFERENMILPIILDMQCDDLYPSLSTDRALRLQEYEALILNDFNHYVRVVNNIVNDAKSRNLTRKEFAVAVIRDQPKWLHAAFFSGLDDKSIPEAVKGCALRNPEQFTGHRWNT